MAKFKNKKGGICEVFSLDNINKLKKDKNYIEITDKIKKSNISNIQNEKVQNSEENNK